MTLINHNPQLYQRVVEHCAPLLIENGGPLAEIEEEPFSGDDAKEIMDRLKPQMPCGFLWADGWTYRDDQEAGLFLKIDKTVQYSLLTLIDTQTETIRRTQFQHEVSDLFENQIMSRYITTAENLELNAWTYWQVFPLEGGVVAIENLFGVIFRFSMRYVSGPTSIPDKAD